MSIFLLKKKEYPHFFFFFFLRNQKMSPFFVGKKKAHGLE